MKQVLIRQGQMRVEDVPAPMPQIGRVLVRVSHSCISAGTEMNSLHAASKPLWQRSLTDPAKLTKAIHVLRQEGLARLTHLVKEKTSSAQATGYSATGTVVDAGGGKFPIGTRVACAGAAHAHHAEMICVPHNLAVRVPDNITDEEAATVTLGAVALQGIRRANTTLGESFVVIGLGILGQLTCQLLRAAGCRVIGIDLDRYRLEQAKQLGADHVVHPDENQIAQVMRLTAGIGADGVIITAASSTHELISTAFRMCRKKARVVLVGDVGLNLNRADFYEKELDFFISTSYGPGRYDRNYEEAGMDYPIGYVRWTENRNMQEYLRLIADQRIHVRPLISATYMIDDAPLAYASLAKAGRDKPLIVLLRYPNSGQTMSPRIHVPSKKHAGPIRLAVIGAGSFARGTHLPNIQKLSQFFSLRAIVNRTGHQALTTAMQFGADYATTDYREVLCDESVDAVLIATRHHMHAPIVMEALQAGKHVLVEKPLALGRAELASIQSIYDDLARHGSTPILMTGFNRRFAPFIKQIKQRFDARKSPLMLNYIMNAGYLPHDHWVHGPEGGGRNQGEACHIYDLFTFLTAARYCKVHAQTIDAKNGYYMNDDNFNVTITFDDGSIATLTYTAMGPASFPKETLAAFADGKSCLLTDYKKLQWFGDRVESFDSKSITKGQLQELHVFALALQEGDQSIMPLWQQVQATEIALMVEEQLKNTSGTDLQAAA